MKTIILIASITIMLLCMPERDLKANSVEYPPGIQISDLPVSIFPVQLILTTEKFDLGICSLSSPEFNSFVQIIVPLTRPQEGLYPLKTYGYPVFSIYSTTYLNSIDIFIAEAILTGPSIPISLPGAKMHRSC